MLKQSRAQRQPQTSSLGMSEGSKQLWGNWKSWQCSFIFLCGFLQLPLSSAVHNSAIRSQRHPTNIGEAWLGDGEQLCRSASPDTAPWTNCSAPPAAEPNHTLPHLLSDEVTNILKNLIIVLWNVNLQHMLVFGKVKGNGAGTPV